ncbi:MAG: Holliday junction branch migration protein RuvA [Sporichthyaceae bacterium]
MISFVSGRVAEIGLDCAVLEVGGIGLSLHCTPGTLRGLRLGEHATLSSALIVREDSLTLFGFADAEERAVFDVLIGITGIGPKMAQAVLSALTPEQLRLAVASEDKATLNKVSGVGPKLAARMVLELKDRIGPPRGTGATIPGPAAPVEDARRTQVHGALLNLGWSAREADAAWDSVVEQADPEGAEVPELLRLALRTLGKSA